MGEQGRVALTISALAVIVALGLLVAWVTFGLLDSSATAEVRGYKLGGAIAAFAFTAGLLTTAFFNVYRMLTSDRLKEYMQQAEEQRKEYTRQTNDQLKDCASRVAELQSKLIRGAPCPPGYAIDVDERHKLVFARPSGWLNPEGYLYRYEEKQKPNDPARANFNVVYEDLSDKLPAGFDPAQPLVLDQLYQQALQPMAARFPGALSTEFVMVDGLKSVKYINTYLAKAPGPTPTDPPTTVTLRQSGVATYVPQMKALYVFTFTDDEADYLASSEVFNTVMASVRFLP